MRPRCHHRVTEWSVGISAAAGFCGDDRLGVPLARHVVCELETHSGREWMFSSVAEDPRPPSNNVCPLGAGKARRAYIGWLMNEAPILFDRTAGVATIT